MKLLVLTMITANLLFSCQSKSNSKLKAFITVENDDSILNVYYLKATTSYGVEKSENERLFFDNFPNTFGKFNQLYGFIDTAMPLYSLGEEHLALLESLRSIPSNEYYSKYISIAIRGNWQADNISYFQSSLYNKINSNPKLIISLLENYSKADIKSFWHFLFDGPHPEDKQVKESFEKLYEKINSLNKEMAETMKDEYAKSIKSSDGHGHWGNI